MPLVIAGLIVAFLVMMLFGGSDLDRLLTLLVTTLDTPRLDAAAVVMDQLTRPLPLVATGLLGAAIPLMQKRWHDAFLLVALVLSGWLLPWAIQMLTAGLHGAQPLPGATAYGRYPDLGAAQATITALALAFLATRRFPARLWALIGAALFAMLAGAVPLLLATNWPSAMVGGWALGLGWTLLLLRISGADLGDGMVHRAEPPSASPPAQDQHQIVGGHRDDPLQR